jgi:hypothetical protein
MPEEEGCASLHAVCSWSLRFTVRDPVVIQLGCVIIQFSCLVI